MGHSSKQTACLFFALPLEFQQEGLDYLVGFWNSASHSTDLRRDLFHDANQRRPVDPRRPTAGSNATNSHQQSNDGNYRRQHVLFEQQFGLGTSHPMEPHKYDCSTQTWSLLAPMLMERESAVSIALNNAIYVFGGTGKSSTQLTCCEKLDVTNGKWSILPPMRVGRYLHAVAACSETGAIFVIGGEGENNCALNSIEQFDTKSETWVSKHEQAVAQLPGPLSCPSAVLLENDLIVLGGWSCMDNMDPDSDCDDAFPTWCVWPLKLAAQKKLDKYLAHGEDWLICPKDWDGQLL